MEKSHKKKESGHSRKYFVFVVLNKKVLEKIFLMVGLNNSKYIRMILALFCGLSVCNFAEAFFDDTGFLARLPGMAGSGSALVGDIDAIYYNPAGLYLVKNIVFATSFGRFFWGMSPDIPSVKTMALSLPPGSIRKTGIFNNGVTGLSYKGTETGLYDENTITAAYASRVRLFSADMLAGGNIKYMSVYHKQRPQTSLDPLFSQGGEFGKTVVAADAGLKYLYKNINFAFMVENLFSPSIDFSRSRNLPVRLRLGCWLPVESVPVTLDIISDSGLNFATGFEKWIQNGRYCLRGGFSFGTRNHSFISAGSSYNLNNLKIDYAFSMNTGTGDSLSQNHRISFIYYFISAEILSGKNRSVRPVSAGMEPGRKKAPQIEKAAPVISPPSPGPSPGPAPAPPPAPAEPAGLEEKPQGKYTVQNGDSLQSISEKFYGDAKRWQDIYMINKDSIEKGILRPGQELELP